MADAPEEMGHFGICVAISENNLICGAPFEQNEEGGESGAAYIYDMQNFVDLEEVVPDQITIFRESSISQPQCIQFQIVLGLRNRLRYRLIYIGFLKRFDQMFLKSPPWPLSFCMRPFGKIIN